jgi:hypothetical protein
VQEVLDRYSYQIAGRPSDSFPIINCDRHSINSLVDSEANDHTNQTNQTKANQFTEPTAQPHGDS